MAKRYCAACLHCIALASVLSVPRAFCSDWAKQAQAIIELPQKIVVNPAEQGPREGDPIQFDVQVQNGKNQPVPISKDTQIEVQLTNSSGEVAQTATCKVAAQSANAKCSVQAPKAGVYKVKAAPSNKGLLDGSGVLLVRPPAQKPRSELLRTWPARGVSFLNAAFFEDSSGESGAQMSPACTGSSGPARVVVTIDEGGENRGAFRAGVDSATIQALFESDDGGAAPVPIYVWLSQDHGKLDQNPIVIPKCGISSGQAHLSATYPTTASVIYTVLPAKYGSPGSPNLQATFIPIIGLGVLPQPPPPQVLSLIDREPIVVQFFDFQGHSVPTDSPRTVSFVSNNSVVGVQNQSISVGPGASTAETMIIPYWIGTGSIYVTADRLQAIAHQVNIVGWNAILVCLVGGVLGGIVLYLTSGGSVIARLIVGVAAGIVLTWAYVFGLLPRVDASIAHNYVSVFVVSILGGYLGIKAFDQVLKRLGWTHW